MTRPTAHGTESGPTKKRFGKNLNKQQAKLYSPPPPTAPSTCDHRGLVLLTLTSKRSSSGGLLSSKCRVPIVGPKEVENDPKTTQDGRNDDQAQAVDQNQPSDDLDDEGGNRQSDFAANIKLSNLHRGEEHARDIDGREQQCIARPTSFFGENEEHSAGPGSPGSPGQWNESGIVRNNVEEIHSSSSRILWEPTSPSDSRTQIQNVVDEVNDGVLMLASEEEGKDIKVVSHLASYEDRTRGSEGARLGPRMLFDPKSGTMMEVKEKKVSGKESSNKSRKLKGTAGSKGKSKDKKTTKTRTSSRSRNMKPAALKTDLENAPFNKSKLTRVQRVPSRPPRTLGVLFIRDSEGGELYSADGCLPEAGYGSHSVPGGVSQSKVEHDVKRGETVELLTGVEQHTLKATASEWAPNYTEAQLDVQSEALESKDGGEMKVKVDELISSLDHLGFDKKAAVSSEFATGAENKVASKHVYTAKNLFSYGEDSPWSSVDDTVSQWTALPLQNEGNAKQT